MKGKKKDAHAQILMHCILGIFPVLEWGISFFAPPGFLILPAL